jgi:hypothetical protein
MKYVIFFPGRPKLFFVALPTAYPLQVFLMTELSCENGEFFLFELR